MSQVAEDQYYLFKPFTVPKYRIKFERAHQLADVAGYVWYTPAPIYLWGRFSEINLADLVQRCNLQIFWYQFEQPVFQGLQLPNDPAWNHSLWAARQDQWNQLVDAILETVQFDLPNKRLYQYALQKLNIYDPLVHDARKVLTPGMPLVEVNVFAVLTNERQYAFDTRQEQVQSTPSIVSFRPSKLHVEAANSLFSLPRLTQDNAFAQYKEIMTRAQDLEHQKRIEQYRK